jgi:general secretion pathway protein G
MTRAAEGERRGGINMSGKFMQADSIGPTGRRTLVARGFTLVEILIVVIILGVLAAIVIPQFANASADTKKNSLAASLHAVRTQIEFYMLQHGEMTPALTGSDWTPLTDQSTYRGTTCGPYLRAAPINQLNGKSDILVVAADVVVGTPIAGATGMGWIYNPLSGKMWATNTAEDRVYNEMDPSDPNN